MFYKKQSKFSSSTNKITNNLGIPTKAGEGQFGTSRFASKKEYNKMFTKEILYKNISIDKQNFRKAGLVAGYVHKKSKEIIYYIKDNIHSLIIGATRSGKTRTLVLQTIGIQALAGESMILSDPKGELFYYTSEFLKRRGYNVITLDFINPSKSNKYNFLQEVINAIKGNNFDEAVRMALELCEIIVPPNNTSEELWRNGEIAIISASIMAVLIQNMDKPENQNLSNVYHFISTMCKLDSKGNMPIDAYLDTLSENHPARKLFAPALISSPKTRVSYVTCALTTLRLFANNDIYNMTCKSEFDLSKTGMEKTAIFLMLPDEKVAYYKLATLFVKQQYSALIDSARKTGGELNLRVNYNLDEFGNFATLPDFGTMLTVAGGRNIRFNIFVQSISQLIEKYGRETALNITDNCETWVYLKTSNTETAKIISDKLGTYTTSSHSKGNSYNTSSTGESENMSLISRHLLMPDEILRMERPYVLIMKTGFYPVITKIPDINKWYFNYLYGMGDREHNKELIMKREESRVTNKVDEISFWNKEEKQDDEEYYYN